MHQLVEISSSQLASFKREFCSIVVVSPQNIQYNLIILQPCMYSQRLEK